jgi:polysaccharide biosynthesis protein PslG
MVISRSRSQAGSETLMKKILTAIILALCISVGTLQFWSLRTPTRLHLPEQQHVETTNPKIGIHTRLGGIPDEAIIARALQQVREMGASWIVDLFPWSYVQPRSRYGYDWNGADMVISHASRQGLTILARLDIVPQWARPNNSNDRYLDRDHYDDYANYVVAFLQRYRPYGVRHVIIWNEPNLSAEWGRRPPDPQAYAALLKVVYPKVKQAAPDAIVIAGALSPGEDIGSGSERLNDLTYMRLLYDAGAAPYFDMWAVHSYGDKSPPDASPNPSTVNFRRIEIVRERMIARGDGNKKMVITEGAGTIVYGGLRPYAHHSDCGGQLKHTNWQSSGIGWRQYVYGSLGRPSQRILTKITGRLLPPMERPRPFTGLCRRRHVDNDHKQSQRSIHYQGC